MNECYIENKVAQMFPVEQSEPLSKMNKERKIACIMNSLYDEIQKGYYELETRLVRSLEKKLREQL
jgi:hypothetical protein